MSKKNSANEIFITRIYYASVKDVWDAWTDPKKVEKWWGPRGFTITTHSKDLRVGGHWTYTMHGPDGTDYLNKTKYLEVDKYSRLVYDHGGNEDLDRPPMFRVTVLFSENNGKTKMEMSMKFPSSEAYEESKKIIKKANGNSTWDRLAEYLEKESTGKEIFTINRTFETPISVIQKMWMEPKHFSKWMKPIDIKTMTAKKDKLTYTQRLSNETNGPKTMLTTITFFEDEPNATRISVICEPQGRVPPDELKIFVNTKDAMTQGWTGYLDKLETYLAETKI